MLKHLLSKYYLIILGIFVVISCTKTIEQDPNPQDSYRYFPIEVGDYKLYQLVTKSYGIAQKERIDTVEVKEIVKSKSKSNNDTYYIIERQSKGKNDFFFKPELVYQVITNPKQVINEERNVYTVQLSYPLYKGAKWNLNEINGRDEDYAKIVDYNKLPPKLITDKNLIKVLSDSTNNFINMAVNYTIFAKDIGPIYFEKSYIDYCQEDCDNPNSCCRKFIISSGKREFKTLIEVGKIN